jgi:hypothetical protein
MQVNQQLYNDLGMVINEKGKREAVKKWETVGLRLKKIST